MSNSYMKSAYFQTQVNQANRIKECYPCGTSCNQIVTNYIPTDLTLSTLTVTGKATILGLIDPTGMEFTPVTTNPGLIEANTIWVNSTDANKLYFGANPITGGSGGWSGNATTDLNMNQSSILNVPIINVERPSTDGKPTINFIDPAMSASFYLEASPQTGNLQATGVKNFVVYSAAVGEGVEMGNDGGGNNYFRGLGQPLRISQSQGTEGTTYMLFDGDGVSLSANGDVNINSNVGSAFVTVASNFTVSTASATAGYTFSSQLYYTNSETQLVNPAMSEQVPTNKVAVPEFQERAPIPANSINPANPPAAPFYVSDPFVWRYSGTGVGSQYCRTTQVEVDVDITVLGAAMNDIIQWGIVMFDVEGGGAYSSIGAFRSFDELDPATGIEYTTLPRKTNPTGSFNHTASIHCYFDGVYNIADGNSVVFRIYAISRSSLLASEEGLISYRIRPITNVT